MSGIRRPFGGLQRVRRIRTVAILPTLFTLGNLLCGFFAIVVASRVDAPTSREVPTAGRILQRETQPVAFSLDKADPTHNVLFGVLLILAAMVLDALDGHVARLAKSTSNFGAELDSLCDLVSFGVAPAFMLVKMCPSFSFLHKEAVWAIAAVFAACAALRLARFNVETSEDDDHSKFSGLPVPAAASAVGSFAVLFYTLRREHNLLSNAPQIDLWIQNLLPFFALATALLMVSRIPYPHLMNRLLSGQRSFSHLVKIIVAVLALAMAPGFSLPILCVLFVLHAPIQYAWQELVQKSPHEEPMF